ncbi:MAG: BrnT family toxin [Burkholderiaceae bacterium]|nr:BrnT family toxin [Burkholderiaceae bacterium]
MKITFDPGKDIRNRAKHGISLAEAENIDWEKSVEWVDRRFDYRETRICALAPIGRRIFFVLYVTRDLQRRIIGLRKANEREVRKYALQRKASAD